MGKFDKKVLKYLAKSDTDVDAGDIAIDLRIDEDAVQDALDNLKSEGKVESVTRKGKLVWQQSTGEPPEIVVKPEKEVKFEPDILDLDDSPVAESPFEDRTVPLPRVEIPVPTKKEEKPDLPVQQAPAPKKVARDLGGSGDDFDDLPSHGGGGGAKTVIAIILSVVISGVIAFVIVNSSKQQFSSGLQAMEQKSSESNARLEQRIVDLSKEVSTLTEAMGRLQQPRTAAKPRVAPARARKARSARRAPPKPQEESESESSEFSSSESEGGETSESSTNESSE